MGKERASQGDELVVNRVRSSTTDTPGRSLSRVRNHELVIDEPVHAGGPGEEITPAEAFLAGVSSCGVTLIEMHAKETGVPLAGLDVTIEGTRTAAEPNRFARVSMTFEVGGVSQTQAESLVETYRQR